MKYDVILAVLAGMSGFATTGWTGTSSKPAVAHSLVPAVAHSLVPPCAQTITCVGDCDWGITSGWGEVDDVTLSVENENTRLCECYYGLSGTETPICTGYACDYTVTATITVPGALSYQGGAMNCTQTTGGVATIVLQPPSCGSMAYDDVLFYRWLGCWTSVIAEVHVEATCGSTLCPGNYCPATPP